MIFNLIVYEMFNQIVQVQVAAFLVKTLKVIDDKISCFVNINSTYL